MSLINIGTGPNTGDGESLRSAFNKINTQFDGISAGTITLPASGISLAAGNLGTNSVTQTLISHLSAKLPSAKDLGFTGSGNERTLLQTLLTAGHSFYIPAGMTITIGSGVTVSANYSRIYGPGTIACQAGTFTAITVTGDYCEFDQLNVIGAGSDSGLLTGGCITINGGDHNKIKNCTFTNYKRGVIITDGKYNRIEKNLFTSGVTSSSDIVLQSASGGGQIINNNNVTENFCFGGGDYGIVLQLLDSGATVSECRYNFVSKNRVSGQNAYGILLYDQDNDGNSSNLTSGNQIDGNIVTDITGSVEYPITLDKRYGSGIYIQSFEGTIVTGNTVERCNLQTSLEQLAPGGIGISNVGRIICRGNILKDNAWFGIYVNDALDYGNTDGAVDVSGNNISGSGKSGIKATRIMRFKIDGNTVVNSGEFGIIVTHASLDSNYGSINNNNIRHTTGNNTGLQVSHGNGISINGNSVTGSVVNGIAVFSSKQFTVNGNIIMETTIDAIQIGSSNSESISICGNVIRKGSPSTSRGINNAARAQISGNQLHGFTNFANTTATSNTAWNGIYIPYQSSAPSSGTWVAGDIVLNSAPAANTTPGWVCVTGGTPGTWKAMALLEA